MEKLYTASPKEIAQYVIDNRNKPEVEDDEIYDNIVALAESFRTGSSTSTWVKYLREDPDTWPPAEGEYIVHMSVGSIGRKIETVMSKFVLQSYGIYTWSGAFDWNYVVEWLREENVN